MDPQVQEVQNPSVDPEAADSPMEASVPQMDVSLENAGTLMKVSSNEEEYSEQWQQVMDRVAAILSGLPDYLGEFFGEYKQPITTVSVIVGSLIAGKVVLAILGAVNEVPLLAPTFELIGMSYSAWFLYRYLLKAQNRQELGQKVETIKDQVVGGK